MKPSLHHILHLRMPVALVICVTAFIITLFYLPFSITFVIIAFAVGVGHAIISFDELTGGRFFLYLSMPLIIVGAFVAELVAFGSAAPVNRWALGGQFMAIVLSTDSALTIALHSRIERFCRRKMSP